MKGIYAVTVKWASDLKCFENSVLQCNIQAHFIHFVSSIYVLPEHDEFFELLCPRNCVDGGIVLARLQTCRTWKGCYR